MMSHTRSTVEHAFPFRLRLVVFLEETRVGIGAGIDQSCGGFEKAVGAGGLAPQKLGEAEMRECIPVARTAFGGGICRIFGEEARDCLKVAQQRGGVYIAAG